MRMREKIQEFTFEVMRVQGKTHYIANALSRSPVFTPEEEEFTIDCAITDCRQINEARTMNAIEELQHEDYKKLISAVLEEEDFSKLPNNHLARAYKSLADRISISNTGSTDVAVLDGRRIIVPDRAISTITQELLRAHSGVEKTYKTASKLYYWPGMKNCIRQTIVNCKVCREDRPAQARPTAQISKPSSALYRMNEVGTDLFDAIGKKWIVLVDRYSGYAWTHELKRTDTATVVGRCPIGSQR